MAPMSKGVLNPFLRPDNRRGSDSGRFDSIKGVVTIARSVKVACKRLFKASFFPPPLSLYVFFLFRVNEKKGAHGLFFFSIQFLRICVDFRKKMYYSARYMYIYIYIGLLSM